MLTQFLPFAVIILPALILFCLYHRRKGLIKESHTKGGVIFLFTFGMLTAAYGVFSTFIKENLTMVATRDASQQMAVIGQDIPFNFLLLITAGGGMVFVGLLILFSATMEISEPEE